VKSSIYETKKNARAFYTLLNLVKTTSPLPLSLTKERGKIPIKITLV
jgi:hypothetical protein